MGELVPRNSSTSPSARRAVLRHCRSHRAEKPAMANRSKAKPTRKKLASMRSERMRSGGCAFDKVRPSITTGTDDEVIGAVDPVRSIYRNARVRCLGPATSRKRDGYVPPGSAGYLVLRQQASLFDQAQAAIIAAQRVLEGFKKVAAAACEGTRIDFPRTSMAMHGGIIRLWGFPSKAKAPPAIASAAALTAGSQPTRKLERETKSGPKPAFLFPLPARRISLRPLPAPP